MKISILYVNDEADLLEIGKRHLEMTGDLIVTTALSVPEAIHLLTQQPYDVIVSDYQMPEMDGIEFLKQIRAKGDTTPFIIFTGKGREEVVIEALNCNVDFYVQKDGDLKKQFVDLAHKLRHAVAHRMAEEALREGEVFYKSIIENSLDCIKFLDTQGNLLFMNEMGQKLLEIRDIDRYIGKSWTDFWTGEEYNAAVKAVAQAANGDVGKFTGYSPTEKGRPMWWDVIVTPIKDRDGGINKLLAISRDITERKREEEALNFIKKRNTMMLKALPDMMFILSRNGIYRDFNVPETQVLAVPADQIIGTNIRDSGFNKETTATMLHYIGLTLDTKKLHQFEYELALPDGVHQYEARMIALSEDAVLGIVRDITERKRSEVMIRESEYKLHVIFDAAKDGMLLTDVEAQRFVMANNAIQKMMGYTEAELLELTISDIHPAADLPLVKRQFEKMVYGERVHGEGDLTPEVPMLRKDGTIFYCDISSSALITVQGRQYMLGILRDITDRKRAENALRQANKQLNLLSSITRHDIINQLMVLKGYLELSYKVIDNPTTLLEYIKKEEKAANTIEAQITFTKDYQELGAAAPGWQNVNASIQKAVAELPMREVRAHTDRTDIEILVDPLFEKVFYNLVDNALRYGGDQMKTIRVSSQESDQRLLIVFEDDGVGITEGDKNHLFTRGFGKNTGFGLFLSREILAITGITITENGTPGKGARFEIVVPKGMWRRSGAQG